MRGQVCWFLFGAILVVGGCASKPEDLVACAKVGWRGFPEEIDPFLLMCWVAAGLSLTEQKGKPLVRPVRHEEV